MTRQNSGHEVKGRKKVETPLYVLTDLGYVETGYTEQRLDREVVRADRYLILLDDIRSMLEAMDDLTALKRLQFVLKDSGDEIHAARTRSGKKQ